MATILALAAALGYGLSDFLGGAASRRARPLAVLTVTTPVGAAVTLVLALLANAFGAGGGFGSPAGLAWGAVAGVAGTTGLVVFYAGMVAAPMSLVAPVSALVATLLPLGVAIGRGERLDPAAIVGALVCLCAVVLVSAGSSGPDGGARAAASLRGVGYGVGSGILFGLFFLFFARAGATGVLWPVVVVRLSGLVVAFGAAVATGTRFDRRGLGDRVLAMAAVSGAADALANVCYVLATRSGLFGLMVVITSLYPGMTVLLARVLLGERMRWLQRAGLLLAAVGVILVTV